jgi:hypothetical protein
MDNKAYVLTKYDEVLLLDKGFRTEVFGTLWGTSRAGLVYAADLDQPGEYITFYPSAKDGLLETGRTMTREEFEETFA